MSGGGRCGGALRELSSIAERELGVRGVVRDVAGTLTFSVAVDLGGGVRGVAGVSCTEDGGMIASAAVSVEGGLSEPRALEWMLSYNYGSPGCWMIVEQEGGGRAATFVVPPGDAWDVVSALKAFVTAVKALMDLSRGVLRGG